MRCERRGRALSDPGPAARSVAELLACPRALPISARTCGRGLLEIIVGPRQIGHLIAVEQPGPIAARHFPEVVDRAGELSGFGAMLMHGAEQPVEAAAYDVCRLAVVVGEHVGDRMHPAVGARDGGPEGGGALEAAADQLAQPDEARRRGPPFLVACPRPPARVTRSRMS